MGSFFAKNWNVRCLLGVIHFFTKHKSNTVLNSLVKIVKESNRKQNKFWVDQGMEFYNKRMQERLDNDNILVIDNAGLWSLDNDAAASVIILVLLIVHHLMLTITRIIFSARWRFNF